jgi:glutathione S-transferase
MAKFLNKPITHKLFYWDIPGRAEAIRLAFHIGNVPFEDHLVTPKSWKEKKTNLLKTNAFVNLPLLEVDGNHFVESKAILRYAGRVSNLLPSAPLSLLKVDESIDLTEDIFSTFIPTVRMSDPTERINARKELSLPNSKLKKVCAKTEKYISNFGENKYICGDQITVGDIALWSNLCLLSSGWLDGLPTDVLDEFPVITKYRKLVGTHPKIKSFYADQTQGFRFTGYKF